MESIVVKVLSLHRHIHQLKVDISLIVVSENHIGRCGHHLKIARFCPLANVILIEL